MRIEILIKSGIDSDGSPVYVAEYEGNSIKGMGATSNLALDDLQTQNANAIKAGYDQDVANTFININDSQTISDLRHALHTVFLRLVQLERKVNARS